MGEKCKIHLGHTKFISSALNFTWMLRDGLMQLQERNLEEKRVLNLRRIY